MPFFERYDKHIMEEFALRVISKSFDLKFSTYISPKDTDNFDFISEDGLNGLEITTIISENERAAYVYEKEFNNGKKNLSVDKIRNAKFKEDGTLSMWYGGDVGELKGAVLARIQKKHNKSIRRMENTNIESVDLCLCFVDGSLYELQSFNIVFAGLEKYIFKNIFFVTPSRFIRYSKDTGFQEYARCV